MKNIMKIFDVHIHSSNTTTNPEGLPSLNRGGKGFFCKILYPDYNKATSVIKK